LKSRRYQHLPSKSKEYLLKLEVALVGFDLSIALAKLPSPQFADLATMGNCSSQS
jgi:hypothetical protein